jgi:hypothetical protein
VRPAFPSRLGHPLWDADLDSIEVLKRFKKGRKLGWGMVLRVLEPGWEPLEEVRIPGQDWGVHFFPPKALKIPVVGGPVDTAKPRWTSFRHPVALVWVAAPDEELNRIRDYGSRRVRSLVGLLETRYQVIVASDPLWEGGLGIGRGDRIGFMASGRVAGAEGVTVQSLRQRGLDLAQFRLGALPRHLASSLRWYALAWSSDDDRTAQFMHFWLATLVLIDHGYTRSELRAYTQDERIERYVGNMVLSTTRSKRLSGDLKTSYDIRNEIVHECRDDSVTLASLERLQKAALELIEFEKGQFLRAQTPYRRP